MPMNRKGQRLCEWLPMPGALLRGVLQKVQIIMLDDMREYSERSKQGKA